MSLPDFIVYSQLPTGAYMKKSDRSGPYAWDGSAMILTGFLDSSDNGTAATLTVTTGFVASIGAKFSIFNTSDKVTNYEKGEIAFATNVLTLGTSKGGTGTARALAFLTDGTERGRFNAAGGFSLPTGGTFDLYNTADQTTNYERLRADYSSNIARLFTQYGGSGSARTLRVGAGVGGSSPDVYIDFRQSSPFINYVSPTTSQSVGHQWNGAFTASSGTQTALSVVTSFNQSGSAGYTALDINPTETATGSGTKLLQRWAVGGSEVARMNNTGTFSASGVGIISNGAFSFSSGAFGSVADLTVYRDAADTLALRRSTNAQTFRVYNTYTDGSNYERGNFYFSSGVFTVDTGNAGTGAARAMTIGTSGSADLTLKTANSGRWQVASSGHFVGSSGLYIRQPTVTVAALPSAASIGGARMVVSDANATTYASIVAGGGANIVPVYSDGTNWRIG